MKRYVLRLECAEFYVDLRLVEHRGRWLGAADTPDGPSIGWGPSSINAAIMALQPFDGRIEQLLGNASWCPLSTRDADG